jgi:hypothetical protein
VDQGWAACLLLSWPIWDDAVNLVCLPGEMDGDASQLLYEFMRPR